MPCNSEYMEPTLREKESKRLAVMLVYFYELLGRLKKNPVTVPMEIKEAAVRTYGNENRVEAFTQTMCNLMEKHEGLIRDIVARGEETPIDLDILLWWKGHKEWDEKRRKQEEHDATVLKVRNLIIERLKDTLEEYGRDIVEEALERM